ncbi:MAG: hypothetical protein U0175_19195 [Caldilineaceae bacterium]
MDDPTWERLMTDFCEDANLAETTDRMLDEVSQLLVNHCEILDFFRVRFPNRAKARYFEHFTDPRWRKFLLSVYYADILSYPAPEDQVDFARLCYILNCAPQGFTVWWAEFANGRQFPVGYTGWYCVTETVFEQVAALQEQADRSISHRFFLPAKKNTGYLYLFNYSIVRELKGSRFSSQMIKDFASEIDNLNAKGIFCATVSGDGSRVAEKFKMKKVGTISSDAGVPADSIYLYRAK